MHHHIDTDFVTPIVDHCLEREVSLITRLRCCVTWFPLNEVGMVLNWNVKQAKGVVYLPVICTRSCCFHSGVHVMSDERFEISEHGHRVQLSGFGISTVRVQISQHH